MATIGDAKRILFGNGGLELLWLKNEARGSLRISLDAFEEAVRNVTHRAWRQRPGRKVVNGPPNWDELPDNIELLPTTELALEFARRLRVLCEDKADKRQAVREPALVS